MPRLSYLTETVLSNKITKKRIVLSFKDSPRKQLGRRPSIIIIVVVVVAAITPSIVRLSHLLAREARGARAKILPSVPHSVTHPIRLVSPQSKSIRVCVD